MDERDGPLDIIFGIGFKIGFLVIIVGLMLFYMPLIGNTFDLTFDYIGFWEDFQTLPEWVQVTMTGAMLVGAAITVGTAKELVENLVNVLLHDE